jgi:transcription factor S
MMLFCPKCGSVAKPGAKPGELECIRCGKRFKAEGELRMSETLNKHCKKVEVVEQAEEVMSKTSEECPKCRHPEAYYWLVQTRASDEAATKFLKCCKCGYTWRDYN